jgi:hypothetical protein
MRKIGVPGEEDRGRAINCATTNGGEKTRKHRTDACRNIVLVAIQELLIRIDAVKYGNSFIRNRNW